MQFSNTEKNYPDTIQIGDVTKVSYENGILELNTHARCRQN